MFWWTIIAIALLVSFDTCQGGKVVYFKGAMKEDTLVPLNTNLKFQVGADDQIGGGYNPSTGEFVAPISGLYQFSLHVQTKSDGVSGYALKFEGEKVLITAVFGSYRTSSFTTILKMKKGNTVSISKHYDQGNPKLRFTTQFVGFLLKKTKG